MSDTSSQRPHRPKPSDPILHDVELKDSFLLCQILFYGFTLVTVIEALRTESVIARGVMNLESAVSLIAGYVYTVFGQMADKPETTYADITRIRYYDWFCTTPLLLFTLLLFLSFKSDEPVPFSKYMVVFVANFFMLYSGYLGETGVIDRNMGGIAGFGFYALLLAYIISAFILDENGEWGISGFTMGIFMLFAIVWTGYGVVYYMEDIQLRNRIMNALDIIAKIFIGIFLWAHVSGIMDWEK